MPRRAPKNADHEGSAQQGPQGCCGYDPHSVANVGGGHIVTLAITNHEWHHVIDSTPYNHYSLLPTTETLSVFPIFWATLADNDLATMTPLFTVAP